jgi:hypothetical protein
MKFLLQCMGGCGLRMVALSSGSRAASMRRARRPRCRVRRRVVPSALPRGRAGAAGAGVRLACRGRDARGGGDGGRHGGRRRPMGGWPMVRRRALLGALLRQRRRRRAPRLPPVRIVPGVARSRSSMVWRGRWQGAHLSGPACGERAPSMDRQRDLSLPAPALSRRALRAGMGPSIGSRSSGGRRAGSARRCEPAGRA